MKRKDKVVLGILSVIFVWISALIGLWMLSDVGQSYSFAMAYVMWFFLIATPILTTLTATYLPKKER